MRIRPLAVVAFTSSQCQNAYWGGVGFSPMRTQPLADSGLHLTSSHLLNPRSQTANGEANRVTKK